jgi:hypothetical protein
MEPDMSETTPNLSMPFILPAQAQKHVTHNEALLRLDALVHLTIVEERASPPDTTNGSTGETLNDGICYLIASDATASWAGRSGRIAAWQDGAWTYIAPKLGWRAWFSAAARLKVFDGSTWRDIALPESATVDMLGIHATPDETNRLAISSPASLFTHAGNGHQIKVNKAAETDTASLLFQTNWTGHAEMGLAGNDHFSIKVSDGATWLTGLEIDPSGTVRRPNQPLASAYRAGSSFSPIAGQESGFTALGPATGGMVLGAALAGGGNTLVVPASGNYLVALTIGTVSSSGHGVDLLLNGTDSLLSLKGAAGGATTQSATALVALEAGNRLSLGHTGTAEIALGKARTSLTIALF